MRDHDASDERSRPAREGESIHDQESGSVRGSVGGLRDELRGDADLVVLGHDEHPIGHPLTPLRE
jgi:hypothetical protein